MTAETTVMRSIVVRSGAPASMEKLLCNNANSGRHFDHSDAFYSGFLVFCTDDKSNKMKRKNDHIK